MYLLLLAVLLLGLVAFQFFSREIYLRLWGPIGTTVHRDEWPGFYWPVMALELALGVFFLYRFLNRIL